MYKNAELSVWVESLNPAFLCICINDSTDTDNPAFLYICINDSTHTDIPALLYICINDSTHTDNPARVVSVGRIIDTDI
jgi:hypothetical protein